MCGILGVIGKPSNANKRDVTEYLRQGCQVGVLRGDDSTGMFQVDKGNDISICKVPTSGRYAIESRGIATTILNADIASATILHHRAATRGTVSYPNCHPFEHSVEDNYICGVHNGTMRKWYNLEDNIRFDVDSDWLYYRMAKDGAAKALGECDGAYALVWTQGDEHIYIAANAERSLHWAKVRGDNCILVASEAAMLYWLASRNSLDIEDIQLPDVNYIYKISTKDVTSITTIPVVRSTKKSEDWNNWGWGRKEDKNKKDKEWDLKKRAYGEASVVAEGLKHKQEVEFYADATMLEECTGREGVYGYMSADVDGKNEVMEAYIPFPGAAVVDSIRDSLRCLCKVTGVGTLTTPSAEMKVILLDPPHKIDLADTKVEDERVVGPKGQKISKKEWQEAVKNGCISCSGPIIEEDADNIEWVNNSHDPLCGDCVALHLCTTGQLGA